MLFSSSSLSKPSMGLNNRTLPFGISDAKVCDSLWSFNSSEYIVSIPWLLVRDNVYDLLWKNFTFRRYALVYSVLRQAIPISKIMERFMKSNKIM